jgi:hypothetical protein
VYLQTASKYISPISLEVFIPHSSQNDYPQPPSKSLSPMPLKFLSPDYRHSLLTLAWGGGANCSFI